MDWKNALSDSNILESYKLVGEWRVYVGLKLLGIKVWQMNNGKYSHDESHYYHGPQQDGPYISSRTGFNNAEEALHSAKQQLLSFYNPKYNADDYWDPNTNY